MLRIAEAREARGWSQERLAQAIGTTQQTVQRWESGQVDPQTTKVLAISKALGVTVSFLLGVDSDGHETNGVSALSLDEQTLIALWRRMDSRQQARIMDDMRDFAIANDAKKTDVERAEIAGTLDAVR